MRGGNRPGRSTSNVITLQLLLRAAIRSAGAQWPGRWIGPREGAAGIGTTRESIGNRNAGALAVARHRERSLADRARATTVSTPARTPRPARFACDHG